MASYATSVKLEHWIEFILSCASLFHIDPQILLHFLYLKISLNALLYQLSLHFKTVIMVTKIATITSVSYDPENV